MKIPHSLFQNMAPENVAIFQNSTFSTKNYRFSGLFFIKNSYQKIYLGIYFGMISPKFFLHYPGVYFCFFFVRVLLIFTGRFFDRFLGRPGRIFLSVYFISVWWSVDSFWDAGYIGRGGWLVSDNVKGLSFEIWIRPADNFSQSNSIRISRDQSDVKRRPAFGMALG